MATNLASVILEGVNNTPSNVDMGDYDYSGTILAESEFMNSAMATLYTDIMEAEQEFMVGDIIGAATVIRESANGNTDISAKVVYEGVVKNGIAKLKAAFQKFIAKIKEFYHKVVDWFKAMTSNAEDFVKNYGDALKKKASKAKEFKYTGYKYVLATDNKCKAFADEVEKKIVSITGVYDSVSTSMTSAEFKEKFSSALKDVEFDEDKNPSPSDAVEAYLSGKKYDDIADLRRSLTEDYRDGDDKKSEIKGFEANGINEMLTYLKGSKKQIGEYEKQLSKFETNVQKIISKLNKFESKDNDDNGSNLVSWASYISSMVSAFLNVYKVPCEVQISMNKEISREWLGVLKKFYNYKGKEVKESVEVFDAEAYAMLESSLVLEGDDESDDEDEVSEGKDCADTEECTESAIASILEQASKFTM